MPPWPDFIQQFMFLTEGALSPDIFRRWSAISLVGGALERRVWIKNGPRVAYPNLYVLLVAAPGIGKQVIDTVRDLWKEVFEPGMKLRAFHVAPHNMTKASLLDSLAKAKTTRLTPDGPAITYHSLLVAAEEFSVLLPTYDLEYIGALNYVFNNPSDYTETRRTGTVRELSIEHPQLNILGGAQPSYFIATFPEEAWATGFARRLIMVYSAEETIRNIFEEQDIPESLRESVKTQLGVISQLWGQCKIHPQAQQCFLDWHMAGGPPVPGHSKLAHYVRSRSHHLLKLSVISAVARTGELVIHHCDMERALAWLLEVEALMPDIFREMIGKSDQQVIEELHYYVTATWAKTKQKPVHSSLIYHFLHQRLPSEKIEKVFLIAERSNVIARVAGTADLFVPRPKHDHGVE